MAAVKISVSLPPEVVATMDATRGTSSRSTFIAAALRAVGDLPVHQPGAVRAITPQGPPVALPSAQARAGVRPRPKGGR